MPKRELVSVGNGVQRMMSKKEIKRMIDREIYTLPGGVKLPNRNGMICTEWAIFVSNILRADPNWVTTLDEEERERFFDTYRQRDDKWRKIFTQDDPDNQDVVGTKFSLRNDGVIRNDATGVLYRMTYDKGVWVFERNNVKYRINTKDMALLAFGPNKTRWRQQMTANPIITSDSIKYGIERFPISVYAYRPSSIHSTTEISAPKPQLQVV